MILILQLAHYSHLQIQFFPYLHVSNYEPSETLNLILEFGREHDLAQQ